MVSFQRNGEHLNIGIEDDGRGFDPGRNNNGSGYGLKNIAGRMKDIGGYCDIQSSQGAGTRLMLAIPLTTPPSP